MEMFEGFPKPDFRERMIAHWLKENVFNGDSGAAISNYGGPAFDKLCERLDGTTLLLFMKNDEETCFEFVDNNFVIPIDAIDIYSKPNAKDQTAGA